MPREPVTFVEIDMDRCSRTWGVAPCTAAIGPEVRRKCFNTFATCRAKDAFASAPYTLRFCENRPNLPKGEIYFPFLERVSQITATVNIAGSDDDMSPIGRRATVKVSFRDERHNDLGLDPYRAERISGAAQWGGVGYNPEPRGTFFGKLRARWPHYTGRPLRILEGYLDGGVFTLEQTRHYVLTDWIGPDEDGLVQLEGKDPMSALADDRALWPAPSNGVLSAAMAAGAGATATLRPAGIGNLEYPVAGRAKIGSEIFAYTRAGDVITATARGLAGTVDATHSAGDTVQHVEFVNGERIDDFAARVALTRLAPALVPKETKWAPEITRWMPAVRLTTHVATPTGIAEILGSLAVLGVSIFWDDVAQEMALKPNRPPDGDPVYRLTERDNLKAVAAEDRNEDRLTQINFWTVQIDPTRGARDTGNYRRVSVFPDLEAKDTRAFGDDRIRNVLCRWFDEGADTVVSGLGRRLLGRFRVAPRHLTVRVDPKDRTIPLAAVVEVTTRQLQDDTGASLPTLMQVISREPTGAGGDVEYVLQAYQFAGRYAYATENTRPNYLASSEAQRARGFYACDPVTLKMSNGEEPYRAI
jgi:hypothetical protein